MKIFMGEFFNNVIISSLVKCGKQSDNGSDRYPARSKHHLGSEHTFKHTAEFLQSSFYRPRVVPWVLILHVSNETQRINIWLLFLIAITDILDKEHFFVLFISSKTILYIRRSYRVWINQAIN